MKRADRRKRRGHTRRHVLVTSGSLALAAPALTERLTLVLAFSRGPRPDSAPRSCSFERAARVNRGADRATTDGQARDAFRGLPARKSAAAVPMSGPTTCAAPSPHHLHHPGEERWPSCPGDQVRATVGVTEHGSRRRRGAERPGAPQMRRKAREAVGARPVTVGETRRRTQTLWTCDRDQLTRGSGSQRDDDLASGADPRFTYRSRPRPRPRG